MGKTVWSNNKHVRRTIWTIWIIDAMDPMDVSIISHGSLTSDHGYGPLGPFDAQPRHLQPAAAPWTFQDRATHGISAMESIEKLDLDTPWNPQKLDLDDLDDLEGGRSFWGMQFVHVPPEISWTNMRSSPSNPKWLTPCPVRTGQPRAASGWRGDVIDKTGPFSSTASPGPRALLAISMASEDRRPRCGLSAKLPSFWSQLLGKIRGEISLIWDYLSEMFRGDTSRNTLWTSNCRSARELLYLFGHLSRRVTIVHTWHNLKKNMRLLHVTSTHSYIIRYSNI